MREHQIFGYIRVSAKDQNTDRQSDALTPPGISKKNLYIDKQSGKDFERPAWKRLVKRLRSWVSAWTEAKRRPRRQMEIRGRFHAVSKGLLT